MSVDWFGAQENARIDRETRKRLHRSAIVVSRRAKRLLSVSGTGQLKTIRSLSTSKQRGAKGKAEAYDVFRVMVQHKGGRGKRIYGAFPSKPGDPPHKQTGRLRAGVTYEVLDGELVARVGTNIKYAKWLELGTKHMLPRPWLRRALNESGSEIDRIWGG